jgi:hypothetical protein
MVVAAKSEWHYVAFCAAHTLGASISSYSAEFNVDIMLKDAT